MKSVFRAGVALAALASLGACGIFKSKGNTTPTVGNRVSILAGENDIVIDKSIADVQVVVPAPEVNTNWAQPGGSASKAIGQLALGETPTRVWTARVEGGTSRARLAATPVVG
ncbi:MAG TPA: pyrrolo-quinoline quinone, partial [Sphingomonas sp.]